MKHTIVLVTALLALVGCTSKPTPQESAASIVPSVSDIAAPTMIAAQSGVSGPLDLNPSPDVAKGWMTKWCEAKPGMTRAEMRAIMGPPQQEFDLASGTPQMSWVAYEFMFNAFMNSDDVVRQLDVNDFQLTEAEKSQIACDSTRVLK